jgi:hypothetical protein
MTQPRDRVNGSQTRQAGLCLRSAVPGRMRWEAEALRGRPRRAAAVELTLQQMPGIIAAQATPLTGRLLIRYDVGLSDREITGMVHAALQASRPTYEAGANLPKAMSSRRHGTHFLSGGHGDHPGDHLASAAVPRRGYWGCLIGTFVALARRVPWRLQGPVFVLALTLAVTQSRLVAGALLTLAVPIIPMASAGLLTERFTPWLIYWIGFASCSAGLGLWLAAQSIWLPTAFIVTTCLTLHLGIRWLVAKMGGASRRRLHGEHRLSHLRL